MRSCPHSPFFLFFLPFFSFLYTLPSIVYHFPSLSLFLPPFSSSYRLGNLLYILRRDAGTVANIRIRSALAPKVRRITESFTALALNGAVQGLCVSLYVARAQEVGCEMSSMTISKWYKVRERHLAFTQNSANDREAYRGVARSTVWPARLT